MSEHRFTAGPWQVVGASHVVAFGVSGGNICTVSSPRRSRTVGFDEIRIGDGDFDEACANAQLIAAAPALLAALEMLTDATIQLAPYPPEVAEAVIAMVDISRAAILAATAEAK